MEETTKRIYNGITPRTFLIYKGKTQVGVVQAENGRDAIQSYCKKSSTNPNLYKAKEK